MKINGTATLTAPPQEVWEAFHDPAVLASCLPGCHSLTETGPYTYAMRVTAGVPAIKGTYDGTVALADQVHAESFTLKANGAGAPGTVDADVVVRLAPSDTGGTVLTYDADASVGGAVGGVGQRMLTGVTRKMAGQFFSAVDAHLAGTEATTAPTFPAAGAPTVPAAAGVGPEPWAVPEPVHRPTADGATEPSGIPAPSTRSQGLGTVYAGRAATAAEASRVRDFALGTLTGGAIALLGVLVGWTIGRG